MLRTKLTDEYWLKLKPMLLDAGIYDMPNLRMTFEEYFFAPELVVSDGIYHQSLETGIAFLKDSTSGQKVENCFLQI